MWGILSVFQKCFFFSLTKIPWVLLENIFMILFILMILDLQKVFQSYAMLYICYLLMILALVKVFKASHNAPYVIYFDGFPSCKSFWRSCNILFGIIWWPYGFQGNLCYLTLFWVILFLPQLSCWFEFLDMKAVKELYERRQEEKIGV